MNKLFLLILSIFFTLNVHAESGHKQGTVKNIRVHDKAEYPTWAPPLFWFTLEGVLSAGTCKTYKGNVLFVMDSQSSFSIILAADMAGREIAVHYDDTKLNVENHWCKATYVTTGKQ